MNFILLSEMKFLNEIPSTLRREEVMHAIKEKVDLSPELISIFRRILQVQSADSIERSYY